MNERFESSPLVELIAEVRWSVSANIDQNVPFFQGAGSHSTEEFFSRLLAELSPVGYGSSERLIPHGFPLMNQTPVVRYQKVGAKSGEPGHDASTMFQAGAGLFTVNAVQPYKSWEQFRPIVKAGLQAFLAAEPPVVGGFNLTLRYVDAFKSPLINGRSHRDFLNEVMGIEIHVPEALQSLSQGVPAVVPMMHMVIPLEIGALQIQFAEGDLQGESVYLMENVVNVSSKLGSDLEGMLTMFDTARAIVHRSFVDLTRPIHSKMGLLEDK